MEDLEQLGESKISKDGQTRIPADVRKIIGVGKGDFLIYCQNSDGQILIGRAWLESDITKPEPKPETKTKTDSAMKSRMAKMIKKDKSGEE